LIVFGNHLFTLCPLAKMKYRRPIAPFVAFGVFDGHPWCTYFSYASQGRSPLMRVPVRVRKTTFELSARPRWSKRIPPFPATSKPSLRSWMMWRRQRLPSLSWSAFCRPVAHYPRP